MKDKEFIDLPSNVLRAGVVSGLDGGALVPTGSVHIEEGELHISKLKSLSKVNVLMIAQTQHNL